MIEITIKKNKKLKKKYVKKKKKNQKNLSKFLKKTRKKDEESSKGTVMIWIVRFMRRLRCFSVS